MITSMPIAANLTAVCTAPSLAEVTLVRRVGKRVCFPTAYGIGYLRVRNYDGRQGIADFREHIAEIGAKRLRANGNSEGDEDDEHGVFDRRGAALVPAKAMDQTEHLRFLLQVEVRPYGQCAPFAI